MPVCRSAAALPYGRAVPDGFGIPPSGGTARPYLMDAAGGLRHGTM
jgi:hypothetical protein